VGPSVRVAHGDICFLESGLDGIGSDPELLPNPS